MLYINTRNEDLTFAAKFTTDQNADIAIGNAAGTLVGAAVIANNRLEILGDNTGWLEYIANNNADSPQVGTILFKFTPGFDNAPTTGNALVWIGKGEGDQTNQINLAIYDAGSGGVILFQITDATGTPIFSSTYPAYAFVQSTEYVMQINYDLTNGDSRLYIDGVQHGTTQFETGTRDTSISIMRFGVGWDAITSSPSNYAMDDICVFKSVQDPIEDYEIGFEFDFPSGLATKTKLYGYIYESGAPLDGIEIKVRPYQAGFINPSEDVGIFNAYSWTTFGLTYSDGYFEGYIYLQPTGKYWEIKIGAQSYYFSLPDQASVDFSKLTLTTVVEE